MRFDELPVPPVLLSEIAARGYEVATPVQQAMLAPGLGGRDLLVTSRTGSGKTIAFGLALASQLFSNASEDEGAALLPAGDPTALVVAPTRELALQVARELVWLYRAAGARVATCVGGMDIQRERRTLSQGAHLVVGTPGRVVDHLERGSLKLQDLQAVVLDEADEMLDLGFRDELETILGACPPERRTLLFSATLPAGIEALAARFTRNVERVAATELSAPHQDIEYVAYKAAPREREHAVVNLLRDTEARSALVFCATREGVAHLHGALTERGFSTVALSGDMSQAERTRALNAVREGKARVLVATDVAARGIDLPAVALVVHADLPHDAAVLQHRSGRTGRAGRKGSAVFVIPFPRVRHAERLFAQARIEPRWCPVPSAAEVRGKDRLRLLEDITGMLGEVEPEDEELGLALLERLAPEELAGIFARLQRRGLPAPEDLPQTDAWREFPARKPGPGGRTDGYAGRSPRSLDGAWFHVNVGRERNADPRWLIPMLCRRGNIRKHDLGRIEIGRFDTRFEVNRNLAGRFAEAAGRPDRKDPQIQIRPAGPGRERRDSSGGPPGRKGKGRAGNSGPASPPKSSRKLPRSG